MGKGEGKGHGKGEAMVGGLPIASRRAGTTAACAACAWIAAAWPAAVDAQANTVTAVGGSGASWWHYCTWTKYEPDEESPPARHGHSLVGYDKKMVLFGGFDGAFSNTYMNDMWLWDVMPYSKLPSETADEVAVELGEAETLGDRYDAGHWRVVKQTGTVPKGRYGHVAAVVEDTDLMVVFGGNSGEQDLLNDLWVFHLRNQLWTSFEPATAEDVWPSPRSAATGTDVAGVVYIFGGWSSTAGPLAELWTLTIAAGDGGSPTGLTWTLLRDSCSAASVHEAQPERCVATDEGACTAVDSAFEACTDWSPQSQITSCPGGGAGAPERECSFYPANGSLVPPRRSSGCAGRATVCARAGECIYEAPNATTHPCRCTGLADCRVLEESMEANWRLSSAEIELAGGSASEELCLMEDGLDVVQTTFDLLDADQTGFLEGAEISVTIIQQAGVATALQVLASFDANRDDRLDLEEYAELDRMPGPRCTPVYRDVCEAVVNDGTAATCEAAGHCTYHPAVSARSCDEGPSARFGHAAVKVSIDLMVFGGHDGTSYLSDLWRYDTLTMVWREIQTPEDRPAPIGRSHLMAVPMSGGMLLWSGYSTECGDNAVDTDACDMDSTGPAGFMRDLWQFANPAGTAIETSTTTVRTLTQIIELKEVTMVVEDKEPVWNDYSAHGVGSTGSGATTPGANAHGMPQSRRAAAVVALDMLSGFGVFGGEGPDGLLADTWVLECGKTSNLWVWLIALGCCAVLLVIVLVYRKYARYRRERAAMLRVTELLKNIGRSGALNSNGIHPVRPAPAFCLPGVVVVVAGSQHNLRVR